ncbi:hypothetical protein [Micromonospora sp. NPDC007230]|uniref:hypothetical protein n=1 Tax=Micromonospora sp. NPDC007230 TaxID=3364237 RepID=UPI0036CEA00D
MPVMRISPSRRWALAALAFAVGYGLLRLYWATGGRWGYTACDRTRAPGAAEIATGCAADQVATLPFWQGWGPVALCGVLAGLAVLAMLRSGRTASFGAWGACVVLVALSFPAHLLFEIPAAALGRPADWRDLIHRLLLLADGLLLAATAASLGPRRSGQQHLEGPLPVPAWVRGWTHAGCLVPVLGFTVPHALWLLGVPFGISSAEIRAATQDIGLTAGVALTVVPVLGGLLTLGLAARWGQVFPRWVPWWGGHRVPRLLALIPAGVVAVALTSYGLIGIYLITEALVAGTVTWSQLRSDWAVVGTEFVFLAWGLALAVAALGYHQVTRPGRGAAHARR